MKSDRCHNMDELTRERVSLAAKATNNNTRVLRKVSMAGGNRNTHITISKDRQYPYPSTSTTHATPLSLHTAPPSYKGPGGISKRLSDQVSSPPVSSQPVSKKNQSTADLYQYEENGNSKPGTEADKCGKKYPKVTKGGYSQVQHGYLYEFQVIPNHKCPKDAFSSLVK